MPEKREEEEDIRGGQRKSRSRQTAERCGKKIRKGKNRSRKRRKSRRQKRQS